MKLLISLLVFFLCSINIEVTLARRHRPILTPECSDAFTKMIFGMVIHGDGTLRYMANSVGGKMLDASGKPSYGILTGNLQWLGVRDECLEAKVTQYCVVPMKSKILQKNGNYGICAPKKCTKRDVAELAGHYVGMFNNFQVLNYLVDFGTSGDGVVCDSDVMISSRLNQGIDEQLQHLRRPTTESESYRIKPSFQYNDVMMTNSLSPRCSLAWKKLFDPLKDIDLDRPGDLDIVLKSPLIKMFDSSGRPPAGFFKGNIKWTGSHQECLSVPDCKFCSSPMKIKMFAKEGSYSICVPKVCTLVDVSNMLNMGFQHLLDANILNKDEITFDNSGSRVVCN